MSSETGDNSENTRAVTFNVSKSGEDTTLQTNVQRLHTDFIASPNKESYTASSLIDLVSPDLGEMRLNVNNGANNDQLSEGNISRLTFAKSGRNVVNNNNAMTMNRSEQISFIHDDRLSRPKNSLSSIHIGRMNLKSTGNHSSVSKGRHFVRSSSIMVKAGGREVSALNLSKSKGYIRKRGAVEITEASNRGNLNLMYSLSSLSNSKYGVEYFYFHTN